jgi:hypothetical protein
LRDKKNNKQQQQYNTIARFFDNSIIKMFHRLRQLTAGDASQGWQSNDFFDVVIVGSAVPEITGRYLSNLPSILGLNIFACLFSGISIS